MTVSKSPLAQANEAFRNKDFDNALKLYITAQKLYPELKSIIDKNIENTRKHIGVSAPSHTDTSKTSIDIVVPVFNALEDVKKCLASLSESTDGFNVKIIVVNDGSDEQTTLWLRQFCKNNAIFTLIENPKNLGYTKTVNVGLKASSAEYVITQNSDTIVCKGWLIGLVNCMKSNSKIGICGPLSNAATWQNVPNLYDAGKHAVNDLPKDFTVAQMAEVVSKASVKTYPRLPFVNGFCFMIKREVINKIGYMDEENFPVGYGEENDYCIRALDVGYELAIADDIYVYHAKSKSFGHEKRLELSRNGNESLKRKHTAEKFVAKVELLKNTYELDVIRDRIKRAIVEKKDANVSNYSNLIKLNNGGNIAKKLGYEKSTDMHGVEINLYPSPSYGIKGYEVNPTINSSCLMLPYSNDKLKSNNNSKKYDIGIHLHLFYVDMLEEFICFLNNVPNEFSLYITVTDESSIKPVHAAFAKQVPLAKVFVKLSQNQGRDIAPFLLSFGSELLKHDIICHIHSKRSLHNKNKSDWRRQLLVNTLGSKSLVNSILDLFNNNPQLGMIFPEYHNSLKGQISWGTNFDICNNLAKKLNLQIDRNNLVLFPAGSFFWARKEAISDLLNLDLNWNDFPSESGQVDGTYAHAVERLLGEIVVSKNYQILQIKSDKPYNLISYYPNKWPYLIQDSIEELNTKIQTYNKNKKQSKYAVYTALTGGYDQPVIHETFNSNCDYILFSDQAATNRGFWNVRPISFRSDTKVRLARLVKTTPHKILSKYEIVVWIDANVVIRGDIQKYIDMAINNPEVPIFGIPHPHRKCLYDEAEAVMQANKDVIDNIKPQMERYKSEGFPKNFGLIETNLLVINLRHPKTSLLLDYWENEISKGSHRDQLSFNYCLWKAKVECEPIFNENLTLRDSFDFAYLGHGKNSGYPKKLNVKNDVLINPN